MKFDPANVVIGVIGLGYVGLPLAVEFGKFVRVIGFDISDQRIAELKAGKDKTKEVSSEELSCSHGLEFTGAEEGLSECNVYIVTVPTPIDHHKQPDLGPLLSASKTVGRVLKANNVVIFESTVYPGATEEECVPVLERVSGLKLNETFYVGYSPERINPGDKLHRLPDIIKVTSGSTDGSACFIDELYKMIITAGTHRAPSIKVAESAKVIENTQRDLNIALINELAKIFHRIGVDTGDVLAAASTKWNFLPFRPGLVGGHCIGVDPYYLTCKAQHLGFHPEVILAGRRTNDGMGEFVASRLVKSMVQRGMGVRGARVLILGLTFKENCPDVRNTKVVDVVKEVESYGMSVDVYDPWVDGEDRVNSAVEVIDYPKCNDYDAIVIAVGHREFVDMGIATIRSFGVEGQSIIFDLKHLFSKSETDLRL